VVARAWRRQFVDRLSRLLRGDIGLDHRFLQTRTRAGRRATLSTPTPHHVPAVTMIHPPEQSLPQMFAAIVAHDQHRCDCEHKRTDNYAHPGFDHGELLSACDCPLKVQSRRRQPAIEIHHRAFFSASTMPSSFVNNTVCS
jgi:hypothetical protein